MKTHFSETLSAAGGDLWKITRITTGVLCSAENAFIKLKFSIQFLKALRLPADTPNKIPTFFAEYEFFSDGVFNEFRRIWI